MSVQLLKGEFKDPCRAFDFSNLGDEPFLHVLCRSRPVLSMIWLLCAQVELKKGDAGG